MKPLSLIRTAALIALVWLTNFPIAMAGALTDHAENKLVDCLFRGQSCSIPATWYVGLDTVACSQSGGGTEVTGGSYARVAVTSSLANWAGTQSSGSTTASTGTGGTTSNNASITYSTPTATWGTVVSYRLWDALTSGNAWLCSNLTTNRTISNGDAAPLFPAGALQVIINN